MRQTCEQAWPWVRRAVVLDRPGRPRSALTRLRVEVPRRELLLLAAAVALGLAIRTAYALVTRHYPLAGDQIEYDSEGWLIAQGHLFWTTAPYGIAHAGAWKPPGYPAWVGLWYTLLGHHPFAVRLLQVPLGAVTIALSWLLGRRLFGPRVAAAAAFVVALYPLAFQFEELLYSESLATPLTIGVLILIFTHRPSPRRAIGCGALLGILLLFRSSSIFLMLGAVVAWSIVVGWRRGILLTAVAVAAAVVVVAPWAIRNEIELHGFIPIAFDDVALYGTFNSQAAHDSHSPYAWRADPPNVAALFNGKHPLGDIELHSKLLHAATSYITAHPGSVPAAFYWNGLTRLWDIRGRSQSLAELPFEGRSRLLTNVGLDIYDVLLPLALIGLWRIRRRRDLVLGLLAIALGASIVFTGDSGTRYRATLEPVIAMMACVGVLGGGRVFLPGSPLAADNAAPATAA
jgi:4-amino-4-deoxy-L-arabinose transferase-like glycosyltransferase